MSFIPKLVDDTVKLHVSGYFTSMSRNESFGKKLI